MESRAFGWLRNVVVTIFVACILSAILLPVYTDEVGWRLQMRAGFDGIDKLYNESCGPNTLARPPFFVMPVRYYSALFNGLFPDPLFIRLSGILYVLIWVSMVLLLIHRVADDARDRAMLGVIGLGLMTLGTMPLLLVWSRPEQPIFLAFTAALLVALSRRTNEDTLASHAWLRSVAILVLGVIALSYHIKSIFLLPLLLACVIMASRGRASHMPRAIVSLLLIVVTALAARYWIERLECPADAAIQAIHASNNFGASIVASDGIGQQIGIIARLIRNVDLTQYIGLPAPRFEPMSYWLAGGKISNKTGFYWFLALVTVWWQVLAMVICAFVISVRRKMGLRQLDGRLVLAVLLVAAAFGWSATQGFRNVYEACFVLPLLLLAVLLILSTLDSASRLRTALDVVTCIVAVAAIASPIGVAVIYGRSLVDAAGQRGYVAGQPHSISVFGYAGLRRDITGAARLCGIRIDGASRLVIDDLTYFAFMRNRLPQHSIGLLDKSITRERAILYLNRSRSPGAVVACQSMTQENRARAKQQGHICCLAPPNW